MTLKKNQNGTSHKLPFNYNSGFFSFSCKLISTDLNLTYSYLFIYLFFKTSKQYTKIHLNVTGRSRCPCQGMRKERGGQWPEPMAIGAGRDTPSVGLPSGRDSPPPRHQGTSISSSWTSCWHHYWHCHHHCHRHCHHKACRPLLPAPLGAAGGEGRACEPAFL